MWITLCALTAAVVVLGMFPGLLESKRSGRSQSLFLEGPHEKREERERAVLMLLAILLPMAAGGVLLVWRPQDPRRRQDFVVGSSCAGAAAALAAVFTLRGRRRSSCCPWGEAVHRLPGGWTVLRLCRAGVCPVAPGLPVRGGVHEPGGRREPVLRFLSGQPGVTWASPSPPMC